MPEKSRGVVTVFGLCTINVPSLAWDVACHMRDPQCEYQFEAVSLTSSSSVAVVVQQPSVVITSS